MTEPSRSWTANIVDAPCPHCGKVWLVTVNVRVPKDQTDANQVASLQALADERGLPARIVDAVDEPVPCRTDVGGCGKLFRVIGLMEAVRHDLN